MNFYKKLIILFSIFVGNGAVAEYFAYPLHGLPNAKMAAWSSDGMRIAIVSNKSDVQIWNYEYDTRVNIEKLDKEIVAMAWSPDGKYLAAGTVDGAIILWDSLSGEESFKVVDQAKKPIEKIIWSPDSKKIISIIKNADPRLWDMDRPSNLSVFGDGRIQYISGAPQISWSPDSLNVAVAAFEHSQFIPLHFATIWNVSTGKLSNALKTEHNTALIALIAWSPKGNYIAAGSRDNTIIIWDAATGAGIFVIKNTSKLNCLAWSPDGSMLAACFDDKIGLWDIGLKRELIVPIGKKIKSLVWNNLGNSLLAMDPEDKTAYIWKLDGKLKYALSHKNAVKSVAWNPQDYTKVLTTTVRNFMYIWDLTGLPTTPAKTPAQNFLVSLRSLPLDQHKKALEESSYFFSIDDLDLLPHLIAIERREPFGTGFGGMMKRPRSMVTLNLRNLHINDLTGLEYIYFNEDIHVIDFRDNALETLPDNAFGNFKSLRAILLNNNKIQSLSADSFKNLPHLQWINIANNQLSPEAIQEFKDDMKLIAPKAIVISVPLAENESNSSEETAKS